MMTTPMLLLLLPASPTTTTGTAPLASLSPPPPLPKLVPSPPGLLQRAALALAHQDPQVPLPLRPLVQHLPLVLASRVSWPSFWVQSVLSSCKPKLLREPSACGLFVYKMSRNVMHHDGGLKRNILGVRYLSSYMLGREPLHICRIHGLLHWSSFPLLSHYWVAV